MIDDLQELLRWLRGHPSLMWWSGTISLLMFLGTLMIVPVLLVKMPADYFSRPVSAKITGWGRQHPLLWWSVRIGKNLLGVLLVLMGIILLILPGQGLLTILLGVTLLDIPGKRRLEIALLRRRNVSQAVNWLRRKYHRPPLEIPQRRRASE